MMRRAPVANREVVARDSEALPIPAIVKLRIACGPNPPTVSQPVMLLPVFRDLIKPQWRVVLEELKLSGGMPVSELARKTGGSYMAVKTHCEELTQAGYLIRTRLPRTEVGRPEIFYSLAAKADALFPQAGVEFTLELLDELRLMYGESAPEKLLFQYFQNRQERYGKTARETANPSAEKAVKLAALRQKEGCASQCECEPGNPSASWKSTIHSKESTSTTRVPPRWSSGCWSNCSAPAWSAASSPAARETPPRIVFEIS